VSWDPRDEESRNGASERDPWRRSTRRHQGLSSDLSTEGPLTLFFGVLSTVGVHLNGLEVEQGDKKFEGFGHLSIVAPATSETIKGAN
jgi:hypothetical protein